MKKDRFEALDAWRGVCALLVALEHLNTSSILHRNAFVHRSYRFVDFFFVLSGFVIAHAYRERLHRGWTEVRAFMIRRIGRLWPLHVVVLAAFVALQLVVLSHSHHGSLAERNSFATLPANVALVHSWGWIKHSGWNSPSWSISTELFAYALFAVLCATVSERWLHAIAGLLVAGSAAVITLVAPLDMRSTFDFGLFRCVFGFMTGVLVRRWWERYPSRTGTAREAAVVVAVIAGVVLLPDGAAALLVTPLFALAVWTFASEGGSLSRVLRRSWAQALGAWSYSIYMIHAFVVILVLAAATAADRVGLHLFGRIDGAASIVGPPAVTATITVAFLVAVIALSSLTYRHIELRGQRWFARLARR